MGNYETTGKKVNPQTVKLAPIFSGLFMGLGQLTVLKQYIRGAFFALAEIVMLLFTLFQFKVEEIKGTVKTVTKVFRFNPGQSPIIQSLKGLITLGDKNDNLAVKYRDHSVFMLITGLIVLIITVIFIVLYVYNIKDAKKSAGKIIENGYPTMLQTKKEMEQTAFPAFGIIPIILLISFFTLIPLLFSALVAFTNYSSPDHIPPANTVDWVGFQSFADMFARKTTTGESNAWAAAFGSIAIWTVIWAVFATFTCFFVGFFFAVILQDKRVSIPKFYRTIFILPYAIPTMLSLFIWANLLNGTFGPINRTLQYIGLIQQGIPWLSSPSMAKVTLILVNIWIGFPYSMILTTSSMTAIPNSLYEAAVIDGATKWTQFTKITFPLVMFQTGPLLIMQFASNINNFGAVFFLTGGGPNLIIGGQNATISTQAGATDLLISWIYKLTMNSNNYNTASVLSILVFIVLVPFAVFQFTRTKSFKDGEI